MELNLNEQQINELQKLRATAALLAIKIDLLTAEYQAAKEREKEVKTAVLSKNAFYYDKDVCDNKQSDRIRIAAANEDYLMSDDQFSTYCELVSAKYAELYDLHYAPNYCPIYAEYRKPLLEAEREFRQIGVAFLRICGKAETADELEQALNSYISPTIAERLDNITRQFINA